ncbi:glycine cleavage system protein GcvH [Auraticoccus sp. F435]|uniref:Glycine cleavage system H protein n=1 Tax=Auraticoccus cholistanensis TaxID=2656650 RepID=A0A6A9V0Q4_9ACTN|nr:glycine cleavage system protein GcvH [Auraticoccus cholistanensis]MVA75790.1 glycine cleavage system protein GcvH [Auraticoccus cholistanensis]
MAGFPEELRYTSDHEWVRAGNANVVRVGITDYAAEQLGDIVFVSLPEVGESVEAGDACGELESTKSVSDVFAPLPGVVSAVNEQLEGAPETVGSDPYGDGWLFELELSADAEPDDLLDADAYASEIGA